MNPLGKSWVIAAGAGLLLWGIGLRVDAEHAMRAYLAAYGSALFCVLGALFFVLLHHVVDAGWSTVARRWAEQITAALPVLAALAIPLIIGASKTYHWAGHHVHDDPMYPGKAPWLNLGGFTLRIAVYFAIWIAIARAFRRASLRQDESGDPGISLRLRKLAAPCLLAYGLSVNIAAIDLLMTPDYHWYSTIFGVYIWAQGVLAFFCVMALIALALRRKPDMADKVPLSTVRTIATFLFAFTCFWGYQALSQWLLIWYANIPEETYWLLLRWEGAWKVLCILSVLALFVAPFTVLMSERNKARPVLARVAWIVLAGHFLGNLWIVMPTAPDRAFHGGLFWVDLGALALVVGVTGFMVQRAMAGASLYPTNDPRLLEAIPAPEGEH